MRVVKRGAGALELLDEVPARAHLCVRTDGRFAEIIEDVRALLDRRIGALG